MENIKWNSLQDIPSQEFTCWNCGTTLASDKGWSGNRPGSSSAHFFVCICHRCQRPTFVEHNGTQIPGVAFGEDVADLPDEQMTVLYNEARRATKERCYTSAVLSCRKLLMHIAVSKGAPENQSFRQYVDYLADNNHIATDTKDWVDHIREKGNEANHEIVIMHEDDAQELILFMEMILKTLYEYPSRIQRRQGSNDQ